MTGKQRAPARIGQEVAVGAEVVSQTGGSATVALPGGVSISVAGPASYRYAPAGGGASGQVDAVVPRDEPLELHVALADVRGTGPLHLHAGVGAGAASLTTVSVFEGTAEVRYAGGSTTVESGQRLVLRRPDAAQPTVVATVVPLATPR